MIIFDAHLDLAWNAIDWNRDLEQPVSEIRKSENLPGVRELKGRACNTVSLPELRKGGVGVCIATLLPRLLRQGIMPPIQRYTSMDSAYAAAYGQDPEFYAFYRSLGAYRDSFADKSDVLVLDPDSEFFRYLQQSKP